MNQATGWAIFNCDDRLVIGSVSPTRREAITWFAGSNKTKVECRRYWARLKAEQGFSVRTVVIQELPSE